MRSDALSVPSSRSTKVTNWNVSGASACKPAVEPARVSHGERTAVSVCDVHTCDGNVAGHQRGLCRRATKHQESGCHNGRNVGDRALVGCHRDLRAAPRGISLIGLTRRVEQRRLAATSLVPAQPNPESTTNSKCLLDKSTMDVTEGLGHARWAQLQIS